jgi:8-oxo-dGTP pyrophosphatase MutT (NUDIX family)
VDADENPVHAAVRETLEETGVRVKAERLIDAYFFDDHPKGCGVFLVYSCIITGGAAVVTAEASRVSFFRREDVPADLAGGGHRTAVLAWKREGVEQGDEADER